MKERIGLAVGFVMGLLMILGGTFELVSAIQGR